MKSFEHRIADRTIKAAPRCSMLVAALALAGGCATQYQTPGRAADFHALGITPADVESGTDFDIAQRLERKPLAGFPTNIAVVRVQDAGYRSYTTAKGYGSGRFCVVTTRDVEGDDAFTRLAALPMVDGIAALNRLVIPNKLESEEDLREAAASVQADMLLLYTFDTQFETDKKVQPLGIITLGLFPDRQARVTSTASAALLDTRNGYVYGLAEGTGREEQLANAWTNENAIDESRREAEREAFEKLLTQVETLWSGVAKRYGPPEGVAAGAVEP